MALNRLAPKRLALPVALALGGALTGVLGASAAGSPTTLRFHNVTAHVIGIGFNADSSTPPPIGASLSITVRLANVGNQFGKPSGTTVGRVLIECTVLAEPTPTAPDGLCNGIVHVPDGYFTISGNGGFVDGRVNVYAVTGGVGPYATKRGQVTITNNRNGSANATVALS